MKVLIVTITYLISTGSQAWAQDNRILTYTGMEIGRMNSGATIALHHVPLNHKETTSVTSTGQVFQFITGLRGIPISETLSLGAEIGLSHFKSENSAYCYGGRFICSNDIESSFEMKIMLWHEVSPEFHLFAGAGLTRARIRQGMQSTVSWYPGRNFRHDVSGHVIQLGGEFSITDHLAVRMGVNWRKYRSIQDLRTPGQHTPAYQSNLFSSDISATSITTGVIFHF